MNQPNATPPAIPAKRNEHRLPNVPGRQQQPAEHRHEQRAEEHRAGDRERLGQRERLEQSPGLIRQREDRQKSDHGRRRRSQQAAAPLPARRARPYP